MKSLRKSLAGALFLLAVAPVQAITIYNVSSTDKINCAGAKHGLWTATDIGTPTCNSNYFDIQSGTTLTIFDDDADSSNWYAKLSGSAKNPTGANPLGITATIDLTFTGFSSTGAGIAKKTAGGPVLPSWIYFTDISGSISFDGGFGSYVIDDIKNNYALQIGQGANDKTGVFGASAWIQGPTMTSDHWDLNLDLTLVPEPHTVALLGLALFGVAFAQRRKLLPED
ncbi:MAG: PEP-CTERM sorting domain-containing protein [Pseudomonadota bacterium]